MSNLLCPFCGFESPDSYELALHVEINHIEDSPFATRDDHDDTSATTVATVDKEQSSEDASLSLARELQAVEEAEERRKRWDNDASEEVAYALQQEESALSRRQERTAATTEDEDFPYVECPDEDCSEFIHLSELNEHLDLHSASGHSLGADISDSIANQHSSDPDTDQEHSLQTDLRTYFTSSNGDMRNHKENDRPATTANVGQKRAQTITQNGKPISRLGRSELGPYCYEDRMPTWLYNKLKRGPPMRKVQLIDKDGSLVTEEKCDNQISGIVSVLGKLSQGSNPKTKTYLCHPSVQHVFKERNEGGFCGYRNIQMLISYMQGSKADGHDLFGKGLPSTLQIQDMIEDAWDKGICLNGRAETGGVRGTRKWIGTPEVSGLSWVTA